MNDVKELKNLDKLSSLNSKRWIWGSEYNYSITLDYLQKVCVSIMDLNSEIKHLNKPEIKDIVFVITLVCWICEAKQAIYNKLRDEVKEYINLRDDEELIKANKYIKALRSFVIAHPLETTRHDKFGMDGDLICIDFRRADDPICKLIDDPTFWFSLDIEGLHENATDEPSDFNLLVYSKKIDQMKYIKYIKVRFSDIYRVAELNIDYLYKLDKTLGKLTQKKVGIL